MSGFGNAPKPPQNKPFQIPGPYSSSGMFDPGVANILESGRLARLKREREEAEWREQQGQQAHAQNSTGQYAHQVPARNQPGGAPAKQRNIIVRLFLGLLRTAAIGFLILMALAIIANILS